MVGVPRSRGCHLCRKRRVKCDEVRPACGNCRRYRSNCPGYDRDIKFVAEKHVIRQRKKQTEGHGAGPGQSSSESSFHAALESQVQRQESAACVIPPVLSPNRADFVQTVVASVTTNLSKADLTGFLTWCELGKLGTKAVLDGAMCSLAMHLLGKENKDESVIARSRTIYGSSLAALQVSLRHATEWKTPETLCSAMLLCIFELFAGTSSSESWLAHARGIGTLVEQRGAEAHAEGWDASMILAFRSILIMSDMFYPSKDHCFLSRPEWRPVVRDAGRHLLHPKEHDAVMIRIVDEFFERLAEIPSVLGPAYILRESKTMGTFRQPDDAQVAALAHKAMEYRTMFIVWYREFRTIAASPIDVPSGDADSPFETVLQFQALWMGAMYMGYWASVLILQEALVQCEWPDYTATETRGELVRNILRSVETVGAGTMGPYRVGYGLRIAYEFADVELQLWIRRILDRFSETYAATDKDTYPMPRTDNEW